MINDIKQNRKFKVGIIIQSLNMNKFEKEIIDELNQDKTIDLIAILEKGGKNNLLKKIAISFRKNSIVRNLEILFFKIIFFIEKFLLSFFFQNLKELNNNYIVNKTSFKKIIYVAPIYSKNGLSSEYSENDYNKIINEKLDIAVRGNVHSIFKNNKLKISKLGIISFHHGDNTWNKGGPPGFWETYLNKPSTGFIIQLLNDKLDDGDVLFRGEFATKRLFTLNKYNLFRESNLNLIKIIKKTLLNEIVIKTKLDFEDSTILKIPNILISSKYIIFKLNLFSKLFLKKYIYKKKQKWFVNYSRNNFDELDLENSIQIKNLEDRYFADPFVISKNEKNFIFVEDFSYKNNKGSISVIEIDKEENQKIYEKIIDENFHMSFPFVFNFENNYYMIPETSATNSIRLYKCTQFPNKWEYCYDLISNINCADTIIVKCDEYYFLLTSSSYYDDFSSKLDIYFSESPISKTWKPHQSNPIFFDVKNGRNGGIIFQKNNTYRVSQNYGINKFGDNQYGREFSINNIKTLNLENFKQSYVTTIKPNFKKNLLGTHHMNGINNFTVFDYCLYD